MNLHLLIKSIGTIFLVIVLTVGAAGAGPTDSVVVAIDVDPTTVNTMESKIGNDLLLLHMHESILITDPVTGDYEPYLASAITIMPNGKEMKVTLEKNHTFHTGEPVTAHDVKWTYEESRSPENAHLMASQLEEIESIDVIDDYNLIFRYYDKYAPWKENMWLGICSKNYFEKVGREKFRMQPVGSGPFRFVSRSIGENLVLEATEGYTYPENIYDSTQTKIIKRKAIRKSVDFKTLKFVSVKDPVTRLAMLETGEVDLVYNILPYDAKRLGPNPDIKVKKASDVPSLFALATKPLLYPIMKDLKFQLALTHAINRQEIIDKVFFGEGYPLYMYASRSELGYDPSVKYEFNPDKARQLIKESSYKPGDVIILTYTSAVQNSEIIAPIIQKYLRDVGVTVQLQQLEAGTQATYTRNRDRREGHMTLYSWPGGRDPHIRIVLTVPSTSVYTAYPGRPSKDILDKLVIQQQRELDPEKRLAVLKKIHAILAKEPNSIPLYGLNQIYAMRSRIDYTWTPKSGYLSNLTRIKIIQ